MAVLSSSRVTITETNKNIASRLPDSAQYGRRLLIKTSYVSSTATNFKTLYKTSAPPTLLRQLAQHTAGSSARVGFACCTPTNSGLNLLHQLCHA